MQDRVTLIVDGKKIENFVSYVVEADMYCADQAFSLELSNREAEVIPGKECRLFVNGIRELTGIVDRVNKKTAKNGGSLVVEGRDLMGLLVDSYCEEFFDTAGMTLKALAERLIATVPFINREDITYQENIKGNLKKKRSTDPILAALDLAQNFSRVEPGMTIFEVLKTYAASRGMIFYSLPNGTFVFGKPKEGGQPVFSLVCRKGMDGKQNNIQEGEKIEDISKRYSKVVVIGQQQGLEALGISAINTKASVTDEKFPFYKPYVAIDCNDSRSPALHAQMLMEKMRREGFQLVYRTPGHSQHERNFAVNELCRVQDEALDVDGDYLIYGRRFEMNKQGISTILKLGFPGGVE